MKFTLTTAFYNNSFDVKNLYESICAQTYKNWEWVVTDDFSEQNCSKDILLDICKKDRRVKYVEQDFKKQMFWNPQIFCKNAEIIVQADSDDKILPKGLEVYHHFFTKFPEVVVIFSPANNYRKNGSWMWYEFCDSRLHNNLSEGSMTFFRAWKNNSNLNLDFNPNNKMKYYFNDYSILCSLEEYGKVLSLPRTLYNRIAREDSISFHQPDGKTAVEAERTELSNSIQIRRNYKKIDTFNRFFEPMLDFKYCFTDKSFNELNTQCKFAFYSKYLNDQKENLLKDLYFDHDINFNKLDGNEDYIFFHATNMDEIKFFVSTSKQTNIPNCICVINKFEIENLFNKNKIKYIDISNFKKEIDQFLIQHYRWQYIEHSEFLYLRVLK